MPRKSKRGQVRQGVFFIDSDGVPHTTLQDANKAQAHIDLTHSFEEHSIYGEMQVDAMFEWLVIEQDLVLAFLGEVKP